ncbi:MAG: hemolysin III family protein [Pseudomonadota bacterium]
MSEDRNYPFYSRAERIADGIIHCTGVMVSMLAVPVLITLVAVWHGDAPNVTAVSIYGVSLIAMFAASAAYNMAGEWRWREVLRRLDHSAIYLLIAGTYTPFAIYAGGEGAAWLLVGIWAAAATGVSLQMLAYRKLEWLAIVLYLGMGWSVVLFGKPVLAALSEPTITLMTTGGMLYTVGVAFHLWHRLPFHNAIWHGFVLAASFVFYAAVLVESRIVALAG